jgi:hypothetical protein
MPAWAFEGRRRSRQAGAREAENRDYTLRLRQAPRHKNRTAHVELWAPVAEMSHPRCNAWIGISWSAIADTTARKHSSRLQRC